MSVNALEGKTLLTKADLVFERSLPPFAEVQKSQDDSML